MWIRRTSIYIFCVCVICLPFCYTTIAYKHKTWGLHKKQYQKMIIPHSHTHNNKHKKVFIWCLLRKVEP